MHTGACPDRGVGAVAVLMALLLALAAPLLSPADATPAEAAASTPRPPDAAEDPLGWAPAAAAARWANTGALGIASITQEGDRAAATPLLAEAASDGGLLVHGTAQVSRFELGGLVVDPMPAANEWFARQSPGGEWLWIAVINGSSAVSVTGIAAGPDGSTYVVGRYWEEPTFGAFTLPDRSVQAGFVARLSGAGAWEWATVITGEAATGAHHVAVTSNGTAVVSGSLEAYWWMDGAATATFGAMDHEVREQDGVDLWVAAVNATGVWQWSNTATGDSFIFSMDIDIGPDDTACLTGYHNTGVYAFDSESTFGNDFYSPWLSHIDTDGNWTWATDTTASVSTVFTSCDHYPDGRLVISGYHWTGGVDLGVNSVYTQENRGGFTALVSSTGTLMRGYPLDSGTDSVVTRAIALDDGHALAIGFHWADGIDFAGLTYVSTSSVELVVYEADMAGSNVWGVTIGAEQIGWVGLTAEDNGTARLIFDTGGVQHRPNAGEWWWHGANGSVVNIAWLGTDRDGDGTADTLDAFPDEPTQWKDTDGDGYGDNFASPSQVAGRPHAWPGRLLQGAHEPDACPLTAATSHLDRYGCTDGDADGVSDENDIDPQDPSQWYDSDHDGRGDNVSGTDGDACPHVPGFSEHDRLGCPDADGDGHSDPLGAWTTAQGADAFVLDPTQWADADGDGFGDSPTGSTPDGCIGTAGNSTTDRHGCPDRDGDGVSDPDANWSVTDGADVYPDEPTQQYDTDGDGLGDAPAGVEGDQCPYRAGSSLDRAGCPDTDEDGWSDIGDACPAVAGSSQHDRLGCADGDADGWSDVGDAFPADASRWSDTDGDGFSDQNGTATAPDACPNLAGSATRAPSVGCPDRDGDGSADRDDAFPDEPTQWEDRDADGWGDLTSGARADQCPDQPGPRTTNASGCPDADLDGIPDDDEEVAQTPDLDVEGTAEAGGGLHPFSLGMIGFTALLAIGLAVLLIRGRGAAAAGAGPAAAAGAAPLAVGPAQVAAPVQVQAAVVPAIDYTQLPGGGAYEQTAEGLCYVVPDGRRWLQLADGTFQER